MDQRLVAHLKYNATTASASEDKPEPHDINYHKIQQFSEQLAICAKQATQTSYVGLEEMDRLCQIGELLQKELYHVRSDLVRRKNLELLLPSPNTQHHLPCSSLLSPTSSAPSSPTGQQSIALSNGTSTSPSAIAISPSTPSSSPSSPHSLSSLTVDATMTLSAAAAAQADDYWRVRKIDPSKIVRRANTTLYVNLTEQMILAQSTKRKRPAEGDLYCHNCKTKDTPEWRRGPMGAKTLCNACGIRWRLSQAEAAKQKKGDQSPPPSLQFPIPLPPQSPQPQPPQQPTQPTMSPQQSLLHQQMRPYLQQHLQQQIQQHQQQQQMQQLQQQYNQSHHQHQHPQQQHMVLPGHVGLAQENIPTRISLSGDATPRSATANGVMQALSMTPSPIAT